MSCAMNLTTHYDMIMDAPQIYVYLFWRRQKDACYAIIYYSMNCLQHVILEIEVYYVTFPLILFWHPSLKGARSSVWDIDGSSDRRAVSRSATRPFRRHPHYMACNEQKSSSSLTGKSACYCAWQYLFWLYFVRAVHDSYFLITIILWFSLSTISHHLNIRYTHRISYPWGRCNVQKKFRRTCSHLNSERYFWRDTWCCHLSPIGP